MTLNSLTRRQYKHLCWPYLFWLLALFLSSESYALECPGVPEQARNDLEVEVRSAVGKIGTAKGAELESRTRNITRDLLGKLPKADKVYLELMMYAAYCSTLRDDSTLTEAQKSARIRAYNLELKSTLEGAEGGGAKYRADPRDVARAELDRIPLPYTPTAFVESAKKGNLKAVKLFLAAGMDPNGKTTEYSEDSALMAAAEGGHTEIVKVLLKAKADVNQWNQYGTTAAPRAVLGGNNDILRLLLDQGVDAKSIPFSVELAANKGNTEALRMLLKLGIGNDTRNKALIEAARGEASEEHLNEALSLLLEQGADVNARTEGGCTALAQATARTERAATVQTLLDAGADINSKSTCSIDYTGKGWTPLMFALSNVKNPNRMAVVNLLLERGADPNLTSEDGMTTLMVAAKFKKIDMVRSRWKEGDYTGRAAEKRFTDIAEVLLDAGADVNAKNAEGKTALMVAVQDGNLETIQALLHRGAKVDDEDAVAKTVLNYAEEYRGDEGTRADMIRVLKKAGAK